MNNAEPGRKKVALLHERESYLIRGACYRIYEKFRNTQKEVVYQRSLMVECKASGLFVERERQLPVFHLGEKVGVYIPDILINNSIVLELKAKPFLHKEDIQQFWHYLKNSEFLLGFLVNFGEPHGVNIIRRVYEEAREKAPHGSA